MLKPRTVLITAFCFFSLLALVLLQLELRIDPGHELQDYLPAIFGLCLEGIVIVVIIGGWQHSLESYRRRRLFRELTHQLAYAGSVMQNATFNGLRGLVGNTPINFSTYANSYKCMRGLLPGKIFLRQAASVASEVRTPAHRHLRRLRALSGVPVEFGEVHLADWLDVTDMLYNIALYADAADKATVAGKAGKADEEAERAYRECAALFCKLAKMEIPGYESPDRGVAWGKL